MKLNTIALTLAILLFTVTVRAEQGKLRMHVINVGQAESILIEMPGRAVLIDAGGEETERDQTVGSFYEKQLTSYLDKFFEDNPGLQKTFDALIISHPHIDHTMYLRVILKNYKVRNFIEGGHPDATRFSGMEDIRKARARADSEGIKRINVEWDTIKSQPLTAWTNAIELASGVKVRFLSGRRGCNNANNDSLVLRIDYGQRSILLTGDSQVSDRKFNDPTNNPGCGGQLPFLLHRYRKNLSVLDVDVYKVGHHGAENGTYDKFLKAVTPQYAVISAGNFRDKSPGEFHGFQHGHPRDSLVSLLEDFVTGTRPAPANVFTMRDRFDVIDPRRVEKGIYCTCWNTKALVVTLSNDGSPISIKEVPQ